MAASTHKNGHLVYYKNDIAGSEGWYYPDGSKWTPENTRSCPICFEKPVDGHDQCIKNLPGVKNACCGHGEQPGYIQFEDGTYIIFQTISVQRNGKTLIFPDGK